MQLHWSGLPENGILPWPGERGTTLLLASGEEWRLALLDIRSNTVLPGEPGWARQFFLYRGNGVQVSAGNSDPIPLRDRLRTLAPAPGTPVEIELEDGPVQLVDASWSPARWQAELIGRPLVGAQILFGAMHQLWLVHMLSGRGEIRLHEQRRAVEAGESIRLDPREHDNLASSRAVLDGGGEVALLRIRRA